MKALILIQDEVAERLESDTSQTEGETMKIQDPAIIDRFNVMICALHNIAVEHEFLK